MFPTLSVAGACIARCVCFQTPPIEAHLRFSRIRLSEEFDGFACRSGPKQTGTAKRSVPVSDASSGTALKVPHSMQLR